MQDRSWCSEAIGRHCSLLRHWLAPFQLRRVARPHSYVGKKPRPSLDDLEPRPPVTPPPRTCAPLPTTPKQTHTGCLGVGACVLTVGRVKRIAVLRYCGMREHGANGDIYRLKYIRKNGLRLCTCKGHAMSHESILAPMEPQRPSYAFNIS